MSTPLVILYGTESGSAERVAEDLAEHLAKTGADGGVEVPVHDLADLDHTELDPSVFYLIVCSTFDEGGLPGSVQEFHDDLDDASPDLRGLRYAMFGLGDSIYGETYSQGSEKIDELLRALGGIRVGEYGRHDRSGTLEERREARAWVDRILPLV